MAGDRTNQLRRHRRTPDTEPELLEQWQQEYRTLIEEQGMKPWSSYKVIAERYGTTDIHVWRYLNPEVRALDNEGRKKRSRDRQKTAEHRTLQASNMYLRRNFDTFVINAFQNPEEPLSLDQLADRFYDRLVTIERVGVLMKPQTILRHSAKYDPPLLEEADIDTRPRLYQLNTAYK